MHATAKQKPASPGPNDIREAIGRRAKEIYEKSGGIAGRDLENWIQAEAEILNEQRLSIHKSAVVVRVGGIRYVGEYRSALADGYTPGEFAKGDPVPVRFEGNQMFVKRPNGKELATRIVSRAG